MIAAGFSNIGRRGFSLIDLLVSIAVIALLISIMSPTVKSVRETARRVVCGSNVRQVGLGISMYADNHADEVPYSVFTGKVIPKSGYAAQPEEMIRLYVEAPNKTSFNWDGLGLLYSQQYLNTPGVFYCPSHTGAWGFSEVKPLWTRLDTEIRGNFQYRGVGPNGSRWLNHMFPSHTALVADGLRSRDDFNHLIGANVLRADLSVSWFPDNDRNILAILALGEGALNPDSVRDAWDILDER